MAKQQGMRRAAAISILWWSAAVPLWAQYSQQGAKLVGSGTTTPSGQGISLALSGDGNTLLVGAFYQNAQAGGAWVFVRKNGVWSQQGGVLTGTGGVGKVSLGLSVAISNDGNTALLGGPDDSVGYGAAWVFTRSNGVWSQQGPKLASPAGQGQFGWSVALSGDWNTALIGSPSYGPLNAETGAAWVYTRSAGLWKQTAMLSDASAINGASMGMGVALSADGMTALLGAPSANATWVFTLTGGSWQKQTRLIGSGGMGQGIQVRLSSDGNTAAVSSTWDSAYDGAAWMFHREGGVWSQVGAKLAPPANILNASFGNGVGLSQDGLTLAIGANGVNTGAGVVWTYALQGGVWAQQGSVYVGAGAHGAASQGAAVALSPDGQTLAEAGPSDATGTGATWVFARPVATSASLTVGAATIAAGSAITLTATVASANPDAAPVSGSVNFYDGAAGLGGSVLGTNGQVAFPAMLSVGAHALSAVFTPADGSLLGSRATATVTVVRSSTITGLTVAYTASGATLTAAVSAVQGSIAPTGTVQLVDGSNGQPVAVGALSAGGTVTFPLTMAVCRSIAGHALTAQYAGDGNFDSSTSPANGIAVLANAAGGSSDTLAAEELVSVFGYQLAHGIAQSGSPVAGALGGVTVTVTDSTGTVRTAALSYVSPSQINLVTPAGTQPGAGSVMVSGRSGSAITMPALFGAIAPGIFTVSGNGQGAAAAQTVQILADGTTSVQDTSGGIQLGAGPTYLVLYGTGIRNRAAGGTVICTINGQDFAAVYAGAQPAFPGLDQVNVLLPSSLSGAGVVSVRVTVDGMASNAATLMFL